MILKTIFYLLLLCCLFSCSPTLQTEHTADDVQSIPLSYAKRFKIKKTAQYTLLELLGNKNDTTVTATFVLYTQQKPDYKADAYYIKTPVSRVASMSSVYTTMLAKINCDQRIIAIDNIDYYTNASIQKRVASNEVAELSKGPVLEIEKTLALKPDLFLTFGMGNPKDDADKKLVQANIPIAISLDHLEETPLARAEWIKFFAYFFNKERVADSLFTITEQNYIALKSLTDTITKRPTVLTEIKYGDAWYVPSGKSYIAALIKDAGADYFWKDDSKTGSTPLSFETVYSKAGDCDYWINLYMVNTKKELTAYDERYALFKAFKQNHIYNNNKVKNTNGYSNYWEEGICNPDDVLADLIAIFYPQLLPNRDFKFYKKIE